MNSAAQQQAHRSKKKKMIGAKHSPNEHDWATMTKT